MPAKNFCLTKWIPQIVLDFTSKIEFNVLTLENADIKYLELNKYLCYAHSFLSKMCSYRYVLDLRNCTVLNKLRDGALSLMMSKFKEVVHGPEFKQLSAEDLIEYISCNFFSTMIQSVLILII